MIRNFSRALPFLLAVAACNTASFAAPAKPAPKPATKPASKPATPAGETDSMPALYRNDAGSKISFALAQDGTALQSIVISATASEGTKAVAAELKKYLDQISGADFEIKTGDGSSGIVLGTLKDFPLPALDKALEIKGVDGKEAFAIRTRDKRVVLLAASELSVAHVAYRFLQELGVRWLFPAKHWEVVPTTENLKFARDITDRPTILNRGVWASWGFFGDTAAKRWDREFGKARSADEYAAWKRHNLQMGSFGINTGHSWYEIIKNNNDAIFSKHPEYYALVGGKRATHWEGKVELSNPAVRKIFVDYALDYFKNNPNSDMVSVDPSDGGGWSESPESQAMGTVSDQLFTMVNEVARAVKQKYPGKMVGLLAYNFHAMPPRFELEDNVYIQLPTAFVQGVSVRLCKRALN